VEGGKRPVAKEGRLEPFAKSGVDYPRTIGVPEEKRLEALVAEGPWNPMFASSTRHMGAGEIAVETSLNRREIGDIN